MLAVEVVVLIVLLGGLPLWYAHTEGNTYGEIPET